MTLPSNENTGEPGEPVFDPSQLAMLMEMEEEGDSSMVKEITAQFVEDINGVMACIEEAIKAGAFAQVAPAAHTIKGSAATFGLLQVEQIARELEAAGKDPAKYEAIPAIQERLRPAFAAGRAALEAYFEKR